MQYTYNFKYASTFQNSIVLFQPQFILNDFKFKFKSSATNDLK